MLEIGKLTNFNQAVLVEGWYWVLASDDLPAGRVKAVELAGRPHAVWRSASGAVRIFDAHCPHMGAHLAEGKVEGEALRCFFHDWRFEADGRCSHIPCLAHQPGAGASLRAWPAIERYGLIWVWPGASPGAFQPAPPSIEATAVRSMLGNRFHKACHPNVVMVNAIDEQHFRTVHRLPGDILCLQAAAHDRHAITFRNTGQMPRTHWLGRLLHRCYRDTLYYELSYWYGHVGVASFGPDFLHLHVLFALRRSSDGGTEGYTVALTRRHAGVLGRLRDALVLWLTRAGARYFAFGDTRIFQSIRFNLRHPIAADRSVIAFIRHYEQQASLDWSSE